MVKKEGGQRQWRKDPENSALVVKSEKRGKILGDGPKQ